MFSMLAIALSVARNKKQYIKPEPNILKVNGRNLNAYY